MADSLFFVFASLTFVASLAVVFGRNPVDCAMAMILTLLGIGAVFFLLEAPFLGVMLTLVYAGAVMVLFLFVIMLFDSKLGARRRFAWGGVGFGVLVGVAFAGVCAVLVDFSGALPAVAAEGGVPLIGDGSGVSVYATGGKAFGYGLFSKYMLPLQLAGFLLLVAMVGVVVIGKKPGEGR
jgi:NADH-quinone oxidoreductase subunit J